MKSDGSGALDEANAAIAIPVECRGFPMEGIRYSPGGDALPNTCKPFEPTTNNPYAVRCIDVLPHFKTTYPGDEFCILPPPPELGAQVGIHPQGSRYWDEIWAGDLGGYTKATAEFEVAPGAEIEQTYQTTLGNEEAHAWYRIDSRMRSGSHHMATYMTNTEGPEGFRPPDGSFTPADGAGFLWNSQRSDTNRPVSTLEVPADDVGLGSSVVANQGILLDVHHFNSRDVPLLREAWLNLWWVEGALTHVVQDVPLVAPVSVPPNSETVLTGSLKAESPTRVLSLFGHRHAWTRRINAWVHRVDGTDEAVYESFDWKEVPTYSYDSASRNPVPNVTAEKDGASSGLLTLQEGDELRFSCHVDTTPAHAAELNVPAPKETLVFGNKALDAEMCILYSQTVPLAGG